ncbi:MAG: FAD-dependent oxidoreductase [Clostridia bacterium]
MKEYDLVVIGSGAGLMLIEAALGSGQRCALVENGKFGGTCLTRGCIPTKMMTYPADMVMEAAHAGKIGLEFDLKKLDWDALSKRVWEWIDKNHGIEENLEEVENLTVYKGTGEFTGPRTLRVIYGDGSQSEEFKGKRVAIAAGGRPFIPPVEGLAETGYITYESFFGENYPKKPYGSLIIVGGGAIGTEFAHIFSAFGTKVSLVDMQSRLLSTEEEEISGHLEKQFRSRGMDVFTNHKIISAGKVDDGKEVVLEDLGTGDRKTVRGEEILMASGIMSNADKLNVSASLVETDKKGWIRTNEFLETSARGVWAIGDINGKFQFRHKANYEAELVARNLFGGHKTKQAADYTSVPWAIYTWPQVAHVGMTEKQAVEQGIRIRVGKKHYSSVAKGSSMGYTRGEGDDGFVKVIADAQKKIIGMHIIGPHADILVQAFVYLMNAGYSCKDHSPEECSVKKRLNRGFMVNGTVMPIFRSMVIHPSLSELTAWVLGEMEWRE